MPEIKLLQNSIIKIMEDVQTDIEYPVVFESSYQLKLVDKKQCFFFTENLYIKHIIWVYLCPVVVEFPHSSFGLKPGAFCGCFGKLLPAFLFVGKYGCKTS